MQLVWFRLNTTTHRNPKLHRLLEERGGDRAGHVWLAAIEYSVEWDLGGKLTASDIRKAMPDLVKAAHINLLVKHGFLHALDDGRFEIHDYAEYQAGVDAARALSEQRRKAANTRWDGERRRRLRPIRED